MKIWTNGKLSPRSTRCTPLHRSLISIFSSKIAEMFADFLTNISQNLPEFCLTKFHEILYFDFFFSREMRVPCDGYTRGPKSNKREMRFYYIFVLRKG